MHHRAAVLSRVHAAVCMRCVYAVARGLRAYKPKAAAVGFRVAATVAQQSNVHISLSRDEMPPAVSPSSSLSLLLRDVFAEWIRPTRRPRRIKGNFVTRDAKSNAGGPSPSRPGILTLFHAAEGDRGYLVFERYTDDTPASHIDTLRETIYTPRIFSWR